MDVAVTRGLAGAASVWLAALVAAAWVTEAGAAPAPAAATGQVDQATTVRGQLRGDLLAASLPGGTGPYPDPAQDALPVGGQSEPAEIPGACPYHEREHTPFQT